MKRISYDRLLEILETARHDSAIAQLKPIDRDKVETVEIGYEVEDGIVIVDKFHLFTEHSVYFSERIKSGHDFDIFYAPRNPFPNQQLRRDILWNFCERGTINESEEHQRELKQMIHQGYFMHRHNYLCLTDKGLKLKKVEFGS